MDSGATVSYLQLDTAQRLDLTIAPNHQLALLADQQTRMASLGEVDFIVSMGQINMRVRALIMKNLQAECFGGTTFHADNDIETRIKSGKISIHGRYLVDQSNPYTAMHSNPPPHEGLENLGPPFSVLIGSSPSISQSPVLPKTYQGSLDPEVKLRAISIPSDSVILQSDSLNIPLPSNIETSKFLSITPSFPTAYENPQWQPQICEVINGQAMFKNCSQRPLVVQKYSHFRPHHVAICNLSDVVSTCSRKSLKNQDEIHLNANKCELNSSQPQDIANILHMITINKDVLSEAQITRIHHINRENFQVFDNNLSNGYNHKSGKFFADFTFSKNPPPNRVFVPQYNKKCSDLQQAKCDELEAQGVLVDPKLHDIPVLHVSPSWVQQKGRAKHKALHECTLDELRFITAFNALNDSIRPKVTSSCSATKIFLFLARWKFHVYADLNNSYFQLPVDKKLWSYLGVMTPFKGVRVMTRTGQGLLGSDVELEQLLCRVLGNEISDGYCIALRDDIIIGGNSTDEAIIHYEAVLRKLKENNLKLSPNKVRIFPKDTEVYGYRILDGCVMPSNHTVTSLGKTKIDDLVTNKQVNSWKGLYKTLIGHLPALANVMSPFDAATAGRNSNEKFLWTPALTSAFNSAMNHLDKINRTYLPKPNEQLILLPDAMSTSPCVGWVLYVLRNEKMFPVTFCTEKLKDYMTKWYPCEKECIGVVLSIDQCSHWIGESNLPTLVGPDSLAVVKAVDLMKRGKHSSNPRLQALLASVNRRNITFFHNSAKHGRHLIPDHLSRMSYSSCDSKDCAVERFLNDIPLQCEAMSVHLDSLIPDLLTLTLENESPPSLQAATASDLAEHLLKRSGPIPLGSHNTWIQIQKTDSNCNTVFRLKSLGEEPRKKSTNPLINRIFKESEIHKGLLVVRAFDERKMREVLRIVVPPTYLDSILTVLHLRLNHPRQSQLKQVFERYFFSPKTDSALSALYESCHLCISLMKFPKELESYNPSLFPKHPGSTMNVDIMRRASQLILVNVDLFSFYITACFTPSEKAEDLADAVIQAVTPIRHSGSLLVRADKAPGFVKLATSSQSSLTNVGIVLELGDDENKNSNCSVDKAISELEEELRKISPSGAKINTAQLAQAVTTLNKKVRNRGLTASEIHFSRDSHDNSNLSLDDENLTRKQQTLRSQNHDRLIRSRAPQGKVQSIPSPQQGDVVFLKNRNSKHISRDPHIVMENTMGKSTLRKALHSSHYDNQPINLAPKIKIVDNKFLFQANSRKNSAFNCDESYSSKYEDTTRDLDLTTSLPPSTSAWQPLVHDHDENLDLIPINIATSPVPDEHAETYDAETFDLEPPIKPGTSRQSLSDNLTSPSRSLSSHDSRIADDEADSGEEIDDCLIFDDGEALNVPERLIQHRKPKVGDNIAFFYDRTKTWRNANIIADLSRKWERYYNIVYENGQKDGLYLIENTRWTFLNRIQPEIDRDGTPNDDNLKPTPEVSIDHDQPSSTSSTSLPLLDNLSINELDVTRTESLAWDMTGTELVTCQDNSATPVTGQQQYSHPQSSSPVFTIDSRNIPPILDRVSNLNHRLPLASTPNPTRSRISRLRGSLPLEHDVQEHKPSFLQRFNPFRKRK